MVPGDTDADVIAVLSKVAKAVEVGKLDDQIDGARQKTRRAARDKCGKLSTGGLVDGKITIRSVLGHGES